MSRRTQENVLAAVLAAIFVGYIAITLTFGPNARLVPLPIALVGLACLIVQVVRQNRAGGLSRNAFTPLALLTGGRPTEAGDDDPATAPPDRDARRELRAFAFVGLLVALIVLLGPVPAVFLFSTGYLSVSKHYPAWKAAATAGAFTVVIYLLFVAGLELQLYHGLLAPLIDRL
ncbi:MAG TPA: tripartite tricarboxylate transporter TctB family protein [Gammaproteobacteria bacterium]|nr:tripartite tricarboxylate transporter TctB family protein [Gammaproteobacteria bacterium]